MVERLCGPSGILPLEGEKLLDEFPKRSNVVLPECLLLLFNATSEIAILVQLLRSLQRQYVRKWLRPHIHVRTGVHARACARAHACSLARTRT